MRQITIILAALLLLGSQIACCCTLTLPKMPDINVTVPTIEVGDVQEQREALPLAQAESATVEVVFGAGELNVEAGSPDQLFAGHFRYNVERWTPQVNYQDGVLTIEQGGSRENWGIPTGSVRNEWELEFSPQIPLQMAFRIGAGDGELDFTGLQIRELDLKMGAGDFEVRFDEPNPARLGRFEVDAGPSRLDMVGIGNAGPEQMSVEGGVGDMTLDLTGAWPRSCEVRITAGVGSITVRLPDDVGVQVETQGGLTNVDASGLQRTGDTYVNDAFGETETELLIQITTGVGNIRLIEVSND